MNKKIKSIILNTIQFICLGGAFVHIFQPELSFATNLYHINAFIYLIATVLIIFSTVAFSVVIPIYEADGVSKSNIEQLKQIVSLKPHLNTILNRIYYIVAITYIITCILFSSIVGTSPILVLLHTIFRTILQFRILPWADSVIDKMQSELENQEKEEERRLICIKNKLKEY